MSNQALRMALVDQNATTDDTSSHVVLKIHATTWTRDSHDLFDYEARHVNTKRFLLNKQGKIFRDGINVSVALEWFGPPATADYLLSLREKDGRFIVISPEKNVGTPNQIVPKKVWLIVKDLRNGKYPLGEGDVVKLGRFKLKVKKLVVSGEPSVPELRVDGLETPVTDITAEEAKTMQCRICLLEGGGDDDPLVCPCQCKGSIKYVHVDCLRHWINGRLNLTDDQKTSFFFKQIQCELCKTPFPSAVESNGNRIAIVKVPTVSPPFIILENNVGNSNKGLHVCSMAEKKDLKLGRGHESDVRIPDVSISRYHATVRFANGQFLLEDHNSKFGTLVFLRKSYSLDVGDTSSLQVGRTVLKLEPQRVDMPIGADILDITDTAVGQDQTGGLGTPSAASRMASSDNRLQPSMSLPAQQRRGGDLQSDSAVSGGSHTVHLREVQHPVPYSGLQSLGNFEPFLEFSPQNAYGHRVLASAPRPPSPQLMGVQMAFGQPQHSTAQPLSFPVLGIPHSSESNSFSTTSFGYHPVTRIPLPSSLYNSHPKPDQVVDIESHTQVQERSLESTQPQQNLITSSPLCASQGDGSGSPIGRFAGHQAQSFSHGNLTFQRPGMFVGAENMVSHQDGYPAGAVGSVAIPRRDATGHVAPNYFARHNTYELDVQPGASPSDDQRWSSCHST